MFLALSVIGTILFLRNKPHFVFFYSAGLFFLLGAGAPPIIRPLHCVWMRLAFILEWVVTRLIMLIIFYLVLTPIGWAMRLSGKDPLQRKIEKGKTSYWKDSPKKIFDPADYERQF